MLPLPLSALSHPSVFHQLPVHDNMISQTSSVTTTIFPGIFVYELLKPWTPNHRIYSWTHSFSILSTRKLLVTPSAHTFLTFPITIISPILKDIAHSPESVQKHSSISRVCGVHTTLICTYIIGLFTPLCSST